MDGTLGSTIRAANQALLAEGRLDSVPDFFSPVYRVHLTDGTPSGGPAFVSAFVEKLRTSFTELEVQVEILLEGEDRVAWQRTLRGVHRSAFGGFPATGRVLVWRDSVVSRFSGGLIVEEWAVSDLAERLLRARKRQG